MIQQYKIDEVNRIKERLNDAKSIVLIDYKGINIEEVDELRNRMRDANIDYFVSKNTFIKIALNELGITALDGFLKGPTAVASSSIDEVAPARELAKFKKEVLKDKAFPSFKYGYVSGVSMNQDQLQTLSDLPDKSVLLAQVLQLFNAPITGVVGALQGIIRKFVYAIDAIAKEKVENE
jgi:large subunit ribosomal protein L10